MDRNLMVEILKKLKRGENIMFTKYGDGEYLCMAWQKGANVDGDDWHPQLAALLQRALLSLSNKKNSYIGRWHDELEHNAAVENTTIGSEFDKIAAQSNVKIPWVNYHLFMNDDVFNQYRYMHDFVAFIQRTKRKKIVVANKYNRRLKFLFKAHIFIEIPSRNWSYNYEDWKNLIMQHMKKDAILLIGAGMCSKVLIDDITNVFDCTCIDIGSSFDLLASQKKSRPWRHSYANEVAYYADLLPQNWEMLS